MERAVIKPIHTDQDHAIALEHIRNLMALDEPVSEQLQMLETLAIMVEHYERTSFPLELPDPGDAILFRMDQLDLSRSDLAALLDVPKSRVSEILNGTRQMSIDMMRRLHQRLGIRYDVLMGAERRQTA